MDGDRFDALARGLSGPNRRAVVRGLGGGLVALAAGLGLSLEAADAKSCHKKCKDKQGAAKRRCKQKCNGGGDLCRDLGQTCGPDVGACCGADCAGEGSTQVCLRPDETNGGLTILQLKNLIGTLGLAELADILGGKLDLSVLNLNTLAKTINRLTAGELADLLNKGILGQDLFESLLNGDLLNHGLLADLLNGDLLNQGILNDLLDGLLGDLLSEGFLSGLLKPGVLCQLLPILCP
jgi:hypothetical protein